MAMAEGWSLCWVGGLIGPLPLKKLVITECD